MPRARPALTVTEVRAAIRAAKAERPGAVVRVVYPSGVVVEITDPAPDTIASRKAPRL